MRSAATASRASSICLCGTSRDNTTTRGASARGPDSVGDGASSSPLRTTAIRSALTPSSIRSRAEGSDTVRYWLRRFSHGDNLDSTSQPIRLNTGPATGHCSRWQWCTSIATRRP